ncbi:MAG: ATP-grasp domain-containing protein [Myxococcota bacterium]|nr:ATP-grasp domain-containing protein [Myxococcota bacterium]
MMPCVLVQDPCHPYATRLMDVLERRYGYRSVCFFTDHRVRAQAESQNSGLWARTVEAAYDVPLRELPRFADTVRQRHAIAGIIPFNEPTVLPASQLAEWLGLGWNKLETMRRFRDKHALKQFLRESCPELRVNRSRLVARVDDVFPGGAHPYPRYVLKPNDGWGNQNVGFFDESTPREVVASFVANSGGLLVAEEYIAGTEYFVNGQLGARGEVETVAIFRYGRVPANGRPNIDYDTRRVQHAAPTFSILEAYARDVMRALGLVRSPFHMEIKVDERGPCLIEVAARLAGNGNAFACNSLHGGGLDVFAAAAHGYVSATDFGPMGQDWDHYDSTQMVYVHGIATRAERIHTLEGVPEVERLATFAGWVKEPRLDDVVVPTVSSLTAPWCVLLSSAAGEVSGATDEAALAEQVAAVRSLVRINPRRAPIRRLRLAARRLRGRAARVLGIVTQSNTRSAGGERHEKAKPEMTTTPSHATELIAKAKEAVVRRLQRIGHLRRYQPDRLPDFITPSRFEQTNEVMRWASEYLAAPHPDLGRSGAICPFVRKTMQVDRLFVVFHEEIDGTSHAALRDLLYAETERFKARFPLEEPNGNFTAVVIVFPNIPDERLVALDQVHTELKSGFMRQDIMSTAFHKQSNKPALYNPGFPVFRAPFPCFVLRHMDVRDIPFVCNNLFAFEHYRDKYEDRYTKGLVSNEYGYVDRFREANERFPRKK